MFLYQYTIMALITTLLLNKAARSGAMFVLGSYLVYLLFVGVDGGWYYCYSATLCLVVGHFLEGKNKGAAICSYLLVATNVIGFFIWSAFYSPIVYNVISMVLLTIQALTIIPRGKPNGLRYYLKYLMASSHVFNGAQQSATITKTGKKD